MFVISVAVQQMSAADMGFEGPSAGSEWNKLRNAVAAVMPIVPSVAKALQPLMINTLFFEQVNAY
jgi:hypothetical protein